MDYGIAIDAALTSYMDNSSRSVQASEGRLGPSDIGFCRQKAALMVKGVEQTDAPPKWAAAVGTAIHNYVEAAIKEMFPDWLVGSIDQVRVTATLPSGAEISGHPDIVIPDRNTVLDIKTVDGFQWVKREGTSQQHKYQRHLYAMGCLAAGMFDKTKPVYVGNVYFDRSGKQAQPLVIVEELDPMLTDEIDSWVGDVIYAVKNNEDASRDIPAAVCERICSHFTACRGSLETYEGGELIMDSELLTAVDMYTEARNMEKTAKQMKDEASARLAGVNGSTGQWQVRWVEVQPSRVESFEKNGYSRLDIRKARSR
jgi:hypothetical protein